MAGPEDGTTSGHHGNGSDTVSDPFLLQGDDVVPDEECQCGGDHVLDDLKPQPAVPVLNVVQTADGGEELRVALRNGKNVDSNSSSRADGQPEKKNSEASQQSCQSDQESDVFDVGSHSEHTFYLGENDDSDEDDGEDGDFSTRNKDCIFNNNSDVLENDEAETLLKERDAVLCGEVQDSETENIAAEGQQDGTDPEADRNNLPVVQGQPVRSSPRPIPTSRGGRLAYSSIMTVCRHSYSQLVVRCQANSCHVRMASSCPAAFSARWTDVLPGGITAPDSSGGNTFDRKRRNTVASVRTEAQQPRPGFRQDQKAAQGHPRTLAFQGRSRSMSESDVQHLLMTAMGRELRRLSDEFNFSRTQRTLTTVSESASELDSTSDDDGQT